MPSPVPSRRPPPPPPVVHLDVGSPPHSSPRRVPGARNSGVVDGAARSSPRNSSLAEGIVRPSPRSSLSLENTLSPRFPGGAMPSPALARKGSLRPADRLRGAPLPPPPPAAHTAPKVEEARGASPAPAAPNKAAEKDPAELLKKRAQVCAEILATEERYTEQLDQIASCYQKKLLEAHVLSPADDKTIFINVVVLGQLHQQLLQSLRKAVAGDGQQSVGVALTEITPALTLYVEYVNKFHAAGVALRQMTAQNKKFARALEKCSHSNLSGLTGLETLLVVPVQRIPRYVLLLREVLKYTPESHADFAACTSAYHEMQKVAGLINEKKREYDQTQRLVFVSERLMGGNLNALRETSKNSGRKHDFSSARLLFPHTCDVCRELCHFEEQRCATCGLRAHALCVTRVVDSCSEDSIVERDTKPELIRNYRKIVREETLQHKCTRLNRLSEYEATPFEPRSVLLFNDALCVLKPEGDAAAAAAAVAAGGAAAMEAEEQKFLLIDLVKWSSSVIHGPNSVLNDQVAPEMFSVSNKRGNLLHTFQVESADVKSSWVASIRTAMDAWEASVLKHDEQEQVLTEKLTGLQFNISGTIPVASAFEKPFTVFIVEMSNSKGTLTILKRYRQLLALHHRLVEIYGEDKLPAFPRKKLIGNTDEKFLAKRSRQLTQYLEGIVKLEGILKHPEVRAFLTTTVSAKNEDELLPAFQNARSEMDQKTAISIIEDSDEDDKKASSASPVLPTAASAAAAPVAVASASPPESPRDGRIETAVLLYDYDGSVANSLKLPQGTVVVVLSKADAWWYCSADGGRMGYLPEAYLLVDH